MMGGGVCVCVCVCVWRGEKQSEQNKSREMRGRIAERPNCYLNQAATKTSQ